MYDVIVLTDERYVAPKSTTDYVNNILLEDKLVVDALKKEGLKAKRLAWSDPDFDWTQTKSVLFRTTWDYAARFPEFSDWLIDVSTKTKLINSYDLLVWNLDKHYLADLKDKGVNVVETYFIEPGDTRSLHEIHHELGWEKTVLKPAVSAAAKDTYKLSSSNIEAHEELFKQLIANESMMLQPFQHSVVDRGELSLMVMSGIFTHAVLKIAKPGDFRVQDDFGGTVHAYDPTKEEIALAVQSVKACEEMPLYARVDIVNDNNGNPAVSELELVEPELWFRRNHPAADVLAKGVKEVLN